MKSGLILLGIAAMLVGGCTNNPQTNREIECAGGVLGGAAVGGLIGNQFGKGTGKSVMTGVGAAAGAAGGSRLPACQ